MKTSLRFILGGMLTIMLIFGTANAQDARSQLQLLQQMYQQGLISKDIYEQKQREILGTTNANPGPAEPPIGEMHGPPEPGAAGFTDPEFENAVNFVLTSLEKSCRSGNTSACGERSDMRAKAEVAKKFAEECASQGFECDGYRSVKEGFLERACELQHPDSSREGQKFSLGSSDCSRFFGR